MRLSWRRWWPRVRRGLVGSGQGRLGVLLLLAVWLLLVSRLDSRPRPIAPHPAHQRPGLDPNRQGHNMDSDEYDMAFPHKNCNLDLHHQDHNMNPNGQGHGFDLHKNGDLDPMQERRETAQRGRGLDIADSLYKGQGRSSVDLIQLHTDTEPERRQVEISHQHHKGTLPMPSVQNGIVQVENDRIGVRKNSGVNVDSISLKEPTLSESEPLVYAHMHRVRESVAEISVASTEDGKKYEQESKYVQQMELRVQGLGTVNSPNAASVTQPNLDQTERAGPHLAVIQTKSYSSESDRSGPRKGTYVTPRFQNPKVGGRFHRKAIDFHGRDKIANEKNAGGHSARQNDGHGQSSQFPPLTESAKQTQADLRLASDKSQPKMGEQIDTRSAASSGGVGVFGKARETFDSSDESKHHGRKIQELFDTGISGKRDEIWGRGRSSSDATSRLGTGMKKEPPMKTSHLSRANGERRGEDGSQGRGDEEKGGQGGADEINPGAGLHAATRGRAAVRSAAPQRPDHAARRGSILGNPERTDASRVPKPNSASTPLGKEGGVGRITPYVDTRRARRVEGPRRMLLPRVGEADSATSKPRSSWSSGGDDVARNSHVGGQQGALGASLSPRSEDSPLSKQPALERRKIELDLLPGTASPLVGNPGAKAGKWEGGERRQEANTDVGEPLWTSTDSAGGGDPDVPPADSLCGQTCAVGPLIPQSPRAPGLRSLGPPDPRAAAGGANEFPGTARSRELSPSQVASHAGGSPPPATSGSEGDKLLSPALLAQNEANLVERVQHVLGGNQGSSQPARARRARVRLTGVNDHGYPKIFTPHPLNAWEASVNDGDRSKRARVKLVSGSTSSQVESTAAELFTAESSSHPHRTPGYEAKSAPRRVQDERNNGFLIPPLAPRQTSVIALSSIPRASKSHEHAVRDEKPLALKVQDGYPRSNDVKHTSPLPLPGISEGRATGAETRQQNLQEHPGGPGLGAGGGGVTSGLSQAELAILERDGVTLYSYNRSASDLLPLDRPLPDTRPPSCPEPASLRDTGLSASLVVCFHNEALSVLLRTVWSAVQRSPRHLLREVILVDDASTLEDLALPLERALASWPEVRLVRTGRREGLVRARLRGAALAQAPVLIFLDAHCECNTGWLPPLLEAIHKDPMKLVAPYVDTVRAESLEYVAAPANLQGAFTWRLEFSWKGMSPQVFQQRTSPAQPIRSPVISGGLFAVSRETFYRLGGYDPELEVWGGENLELSFRVWTCGGSVHILPCSRVGHIFRNLLPHRFPQGGRRTVLRNLGRVAAVWMDDFQQLFFAAVDFPPDLDLGDLSERLALRRKLGCKSFRWYLEHVASDVAVPPPRTEYFGQFRNQASLLCLEGEDRKLTTDASPDSSLHLQPCISGHSNQMLYVTEGGDFHFGSACLVTSDNQTLQLGDCARHRWTIRNGHVHLAGSDLCLTAVDNSYVTLAKCDVSNRGQIWEVTYHFRRRRQRIGS